MFFNLGLSIQLPLAAQMFWERYKARTASLSIGTTSVVERTMFYAWSPRPLPPASTQIPGLMLKTSTNLTERQVDRLFAK